MIPANALAALIKEGDRSQRSLRHADHCPDNNAGDCLCGKLEISLAWDKAKADLILSFEQEQQELRSVISETLGIRAQLPSGTVGSEIQWKTNGKVKEATEEVLHRFRTPIVLREADVEKVLSLIFNWKMKSAHNVAECTVGFPEDALVVLKELQEGYDNCGWQEGKAFDGLRNGIKRVTGILGYCYNEEKDQFIKQEPQ